MFDFVRTSPTLWRGRLAVLGAVAGLALGMAPAAAMAQATVGDPTAAVNAGTSAGDWYNGVQKGNWKETDEVSGGMHQIMTQALLDFSGYEAKGCRAAAADNAWGALADAANAGPLDAFLKAIKDSVVNIYAIGKFGADPSKAADWLDAGKLTDQYLKKLREGAKEKARDKVKEELEKIWKGRPIEVLRRSSSRGGCDRTLISIWDRGTSSYEITIYGNCHCSPIALWGGGTMRVNSWFVQFKGSVVPQVTDDGVLVLNVGSPRITMHATCNCGTAGDPKTATPPPAGGGSVAGPTDGGTTVPPKRDGDFWRKLTTKCPQCQDLVDKIHAAQAARDEMEREFRNALSELEAAKSRNDQADIAEAKAKVDDLTKRDATLVKLEEQLYGQLKDCEAGKCNRTATGTGACDPKAPPPPCEDGSKKRTGYVPQEYRTVPGEAFAAFRTGEASASGTNVAIALGRRHDLTERTREDAFVAMHEAERTEGFTVSEDHREIASEAGPAVDGASLAKPAPSAVAEEGLAGRWTLQNASSGTSQVTLRQSGSGYVLTGMGPEIALQQAGDSWVGQGAVLFGQGGHQIRLTPQGGQMLLQANNSTGGSFTTTMMR